MKEYETPTVIPNIDLPDGYVRNNKVFIYGDYTLTYRDSDHNKNRHFFDLKNCNFAFDSKNLHYKVKNIPVIGTYNAYTSVNATGTMEATIAVISEPNALWRGDLPIYIETT